MQRQAEIDKKLGAQNTGWYKKGMKFNQFKNQTAKLQDRVTVKSQNHLWKRHEYFIQL